MIGTPPDTNADHLKWVFPVADAGEKTRMGRRASTSQHDGINCDFAFSSLVAMSLLAIYSTLWIYRPKGTEIEVVGPV